MIKKKSERSREIILEDLDLDYYYRVNVYILLRCYSCDQTCLADLKSQNKKWDGPNLVVVGLGLCTANSERGLCKYTVVRLAPFILRSLPSVHSAQQTSNSHG